MVDLGSIFSHIKHRLPSIHSASYLPLSVHTNLSVPASAPSPAEEEAANAVHIELVPLSQTQSSPSSSEPLPPRTDFHQGLIDFLESPGATQDKMKFSHSLVFNSVPEWSSHYLNYEALKSAIYRFEKNALAAGPPTSYTDNPPTDPEAAVSSQITTATTNEKVFRRLLDQELHKITEFYIEKERELMGDLDLLQEDYEKMDEADDWGSEGGRALSVDSDEEDDEEEEGDEGVATRTSTFLKGAISNVFSNPKNYDEATRAGRSARNRSGTSASRRRSRAISNASRNAETADLLLDLEDGNVPPKDAFTTPTRPSVGKKPSVGRFPSQGRSQLGPGSIMRPSPSTMRATPRSGAIQEDEDMWGGGKSDWAIDTKIMFKRRITGLFVNLSELKQFVNLNYTGLTKVLKKYDKITSSSLKSVYLSTEVDAAYPFQSETQAKLTSEIAQLVALYANIATNGDEEVAGRGLKALLREHVVWERNTVWREMIGLERKGWGTQSSSTRLGNDVPIVSTAKEDDTKTELRTPIGRLPIPKWLTSQLVFGTFAVLAFLWVLSADWFDRVEEQNCCAILVFVTIFWAMEIVPLFVTALMVPFLVVVLRVIRSTDGEDTRLTSSQATKYIFGQMFSPTIMLLLGGFTLAAALSKQNIDKVLATKVLSFAGTKPRSVLLAYMCVACFASMWISNVAAPVLCYSLIQPILRTLPAQSPFSKSLILGIALASNIGGMASPISSPQNLIALEYMNPPVSWLGWFAVSIPVASTSVFLIWLILLWSYRSGPGVVINPVRVSRETWTLSQYYVAIVTMVTIVLWCVESRLAWLFGDMGIIAILPLVAFYGTGILRKADFDHSPWSIVFLAMGGIGLGKAVLSSGLLDDMDRVIQGVVLGLDIWPILALFSIIVLVIATMISHTIASVLVVPIAAQIGAAMEVPHPRLLILSTALICSAGMGLPISGFPNLQAINVEDDMGTRYLQPADFFKNGIPASIVATIVIITVGFGIMRLMGM